VKWEKGAKPIVCLFLISHGESKGKRWPFEWKGGGRGMCPGGQQARISNQFCLCGGGVVFFGGCVGGVWGVCLGWGVFFVWGVVGGGGVVCGLCSAGGGSGGKQQLSPFHVKGSRDSEVSVAGTRTVVRESDGGGASKRRRAKGGKEPKSVGAGGKI